MALEPLNVKFTSDSTGFSKGLKTVQTGLKQVSNGVAGLIKQAAAIGGITLGIKGLADSFKAFTSLESNMGRIGDIFGSASTNIQAFAEGSAKSLGIAESAAYSYAATFGNLFKNITASTTENSAVTIKMLQASAVIASKTGRTMEDVMDRIRSGLLGSTEAIEDLGINVNISMLEMTDAFKRIADGRSWNKLTFYEQQQIRTLGILEQAHKNFGDEVQGGTAFALSALSSAFKDLMATVGSFVNGALAPIIQGLTTIVQLATTALKGLSALLGLNATINTDSLSSGAVGADEMAGGLEDSADAAKKLNQQVAGFDQFNDITQKTPSATSSTAASSGASGMGIEMEFEEIQPPDTTWADKLLAWADAFKPLLEPLKTSLGELWDTLKEIGGFAWQGLLDFYEKFLKPVGKWLLGEGLPRLVTALKEGLAKVDWEKINAAFSKLWDALAPFAVTVGEGLLWLWENVLVPLGTWTMNNIVPLFLEGLAAIITILTGVIEALKPLALWLWENFLRPIAVWTGGLIVEVLTGLVEALKKVSAWIADNKGAIEGITIAIGAFFLAWKATQIAEFIVNAGGLAAAINGVIIKLGSAVVAWGLHTAAMVADKLETLAIIALYVKDWIVAIATNIANMAKETAAWVASTAAKVANKAIQLAMTAATIAWNAACTIATAVTTAFGAAVAFLTSPIGLVVIAIGLLIAAVVLLVKNWDTVKETAIKVWNGIKSAWNAAGKWFDDTVITPISNFFSGLWDGVTGFFQTAYDSVTETWGKIATWFTDKVIEPLKNGFTGCINFLIGLAEGFANGFIKAINFIIGALNMISFDIPDWVPGIGGSSFGISIPLVPEISLPRLAKGGMAYGQVQAIVGDNPNVRQDPEVISPLSDLQSMITAAVLQRDIAGGGGGQPIELIMRLEDGTVFAEALIDPMNRTAKNLGYSPVFRVEMAH